MAGWVPTDVAWWPAISDALPKPWPREAMLADLRWWADRERRGECERPGRIELARRWGVTDWTVKLMLKAEAEWGDPLHSEVPPARRQPAASAPPARRQPTKGQTPETVEIPPARRQPAASAPPADRPARDYSTESTEHKDTRVPPPNPPPSGPGGDEADRRSSWLADRAGDALRSIGDTEGEQAANEAAKTFGAATADVVDSWWRWARGSPTIGIDGQKTLRRPPDAPSGLRRRDVERGLSLAAERWASRDPPSTGPPVDGFVDDASNVLPFAFEASS